MDVGVARGCYIMPTCFAKDAARAVFPALGAPSRRTLTCGGWLESSLWQLRCWWFHIRMMMIRMMISRARPCRRRMHWQLAGSEAHHRPTLLNVSKWMMIVAKYWWSWLSWQWWFYSTLNRFTPVDDSTRDEKLQLLLSSTKGGLENKELPSGW